MCPGVRGHGLGLKKEKESMKSSTRSLTEGPLAKQILLVSLPLALSNLLQVLFNMSDVAVVGRFAGSTALGAVGSTSIFVTLFTGFLIGLGNGINVLVARFYGARHPNDVHDTVHSALIVSLIAGVILLVVGLLGSPAMLRLLNTKEDLLPGAILYLRVYFLGMPALALYNFGNAVFSAIGETKKPLYILSFAGVLNILLNLFFVIVCNLDVAGVALASATPATSRLQTMTKNRFRRIFSTPAKLRMYSGFLVSPMALNTALPKLYRASAGIPRKYTRR